MIPWKTLLSMLLLVLSFFFMTKYNYLAFHIGGMCCAVVQLNGSHLVIQFWHHRNIFRFNNPIIKNANRNSLTIKHLDNFDQWISWTIHILREREKNPLSPIWMYFFLLFFNLLKFRWVLVHRIIRSFEYSGSFN